MPDPIWTVFGTRSKRGELHVSAVLRGDVGQLTVPFFDDDAHAHVLRAATPADAVTAARRIVADMAAGRDLGGIASVSVEVNADQPRRPWLRRRRR